MKVFIDFETDEGYFNLQIGLNNPIPFKTIDYQFFVEGPKVGIRNNDKPDEVILSPQHYKDWDDGIYSDRQSLLDHLKSNFSNGGGSGSGGLNEVDTLQSVINRGNSVIGRTIVLEDSPNGSVNTILDKDITVLNDGTYRTVITAYSIGLSSIIYSEILRLQHNLLEITDGQTNQRTIIQAGNLTITDISTEYRHTRLNKDYIEVNDSEIGRRLRVLKDRLMFNYYSVNSELFLEDPSFQGSWQLPAKNGPLAIRPDILALESNIISLLTNKADLVGGIIPQSQLPSYVDDVLSFNNFVNFPTIGEDSKIYVDNSTNKTYRWGGSSYVPLDEGVVLGETSATAYRGDRGKIAYDHSQTTGNPHNTSIDDIISLRDLLNNKSGILHTHNISSINGLQSALDNKKTEAGQIRVNYTGLNLIGFTANVTRVFNINGVTTANISTAPTTIYPKSTPNNYSGFFDNTRGTTPTVGRLIENPIPGQVHIWRIIGTYANKANAQQGTLNIIIRNPSSGSTFTKNITLPDGVTNGDFTEEIITIADNASIVSPNGYILECRTSFNDSDFNTTITSITRISLATETT